MSFPLVKHLSVTAYVLKTSPTTTESNTLSANQYVCLLQLLEFSIVFNLNGFRSEPGKLKHATNLSVAGRY